MHAGATVVVRSSMSDWQNAQWHAEATFTADRAGVVDLARTAPIHGSYAGVDGMGLFWSMQPPDGDADHARFVPHSPWLATGFEVGLSVLVDGREVASRTVRREWEAPGVTHRTLDPARDGATGELFLPPSGASARPGVLVFGGSEGGVGMTFDAALLASHGYPALALGYFGAPGLPPALHDIPLEDFVAAGHVLGAGPAVLVAYSRGTEAALLLAQLHPDAVRGAVLYAPNDGVLGAYPGPGAAWTDGGVEVPAATIPVTHVTAPVLALAGDDDRLWGSVPQTERLMQRLAGPHQALIYPGAGHGVGTFPYLPDGIGETVPFGGTRAANAAARSDGWPKVLAWLGDV
ncbi:acyl-CoA thioesterase/BAAT N-terminal domain-containing protein [Dactylosporangium sp. CS-033363]|uniref:acyl-CoA thioesterase/BAAT N-terminal domain-containing protein n=1 Tax=Dactylosporangium sp. CS-033363 TaxID=3239935 RepID=UPI003D934B8B